LGARKYKTSQLKQLRCHSFFDHFTPNVSNQDV
jgi:hypothetical protein